MRDLLTNVLAPEHQAKKSVRRPAIVPIGSLDEGRYNLPRDQIVFDPLSLGM